MGMTPEQMRAFAKLMRQHFRLLADCQAFCSILDSYATLKMVPENWESRFEQFRKTRAYLDSAECHESEIRAIEEGAGETELIALLQKMPKDNLPS
jgi:hypothetical protein